MNETAALAHSVSMAADAAVPKSKSVASVSKSRHSIVNFGRSLSRLKVRRQTTGFGSVPGIRPVERTSQLGIEFKRPPLMFMNSYRLDPHKKFHVPHVLNEIDDLLDEHFTQHKYNVQESTGLSIRLANELMRTIKEMGYSRYRIITVVTIGQRRSQCYNNAIAFVWDHERDAYVNTAREITTAFIQVTVFGIYLD